MPAFKSGLLVVVSLWVQVGCGGGDAGGVRGGGQPDFAVAQDLAVAGQTDLSVSPLPDLADTGDLTSPGGMSDMSMVAMTGCNGLATCIQGCMGKNACDKACRMNATKMGQRLYMALEMCVVAVCPNAAAGDAGPGGDGGVSEPCAKPASKACQMCHQNAVMPGGPCAKQYSACQADLP